MRVHSSSSTLAVDAMGSDLGPQEILEGVLLAYEHFGKSIQDTLLVGHASVLEPLLKASDERFTKRIRIQHASEVIGMDEKPVQSLRQKKDASMVKALDAVKRGEAQGVLSCGNTGSLMAGGTLKLRTLPGIERSALATVWPTKANHFILLDAGANPETKPLQFLHNAILGKAYARIVLQKPNPRIGLLTIGTEEGKGTETILKAHDYLQSASGVIQYVGPIEGFQLFADACDVVVCDGFTGNIVLKVCETLFNTLKGYLKEEIQQNWIRMLGAMLSRGAFISLKEQLSPEKYGGAPLLGLNGQVFKAHGSSNRNHIMHALKIAHQMIHHQMNVGILEDLEKIKQQIEL